MYNCLRELLNMFWLLLVVLLASLAYWKIKHAHGYWKKLGVPQKEQQFLFEDLATLIFRRKPVIDLIKDGYDRFPNARYAGGYQFLRPVLSLRDPELIKQITQKDFDHFTDHQPIISADSNPLWGKNLVALCGDRWRDMRGTLSPSFTSSKMRAMFETINNCAIEFTNYFEKIDSKLITLEMKDVFTRYATDVIASAAFGVRFNSLENRNNEFFLMGKEITDFSSPLKAFKVFTNLLFPKLAKLLRFTLLPARISDFFTNLIKDTIRTREQQGIVRPDMVQLLMEARKGRLKPEDKSDEILDSGFSSAAESNIGKVEKPHKEEITDVDIAAQALIFFFAGFDTVSTLMCFWAYELALNPDVHDKLQKEVDETSQECGGNLTYESLLKMKYMDMTICETQRKWPTGAIAVDRVCTKPYTILPVNPGEKLIDMKVGDLVIIPIVGLHLNSKYFPQPERFDPERFSDENKKNIQPCTYLPFGSGPRNCIGSRFALLETKAAFFHILTKFNIKVVDKTEIPLQLSKKQFNLASDNGIWLGLEKRVSET